MSNSVRLLSPFSNSVFKWHLHLSFYSTVLPSHTYIHMLGLCYVTDINALNTTVHTMTRVYDTCRRLCWVDCWQRLTVLQSSPRRLLQQPHLYNITHASQCPWTRYLQLFVLMTWWGYRTGSEVLSDNADAKRRGWWDDVKQHTQGSVCPYRMYIEPSNDTITNVLEWPWTGYFLSETFLTPITLKKINNILCFNKNL